MKTTSLRKSTELTGFRKLIKLQGQEDLYGGYISSNSCLGKGDFHGAARNMDRKLYI